MEQDSRKMYKAVLLRAEYPYGKSQTWLPTDLHKVAGKLDSAGIDTDIVDLNLESLPEDLQKYDFIGIGVIGAPYVPRTKKLAQEVREQTGKTPLIGGPGVEYLTEQEFRTLYGNSIQIKNEGDLARAVGVNLPAVYDTGISGRLKSINSEMLEEYLRSEFSFFVSQGCKYACDFCAASRTRNGDRVTEQFSRVVNDDLEAICESASGFGIDEITLYLTSLDLFQNPTPLRQVLQTFAEAREEYGINFKLRGLSRIDSFLQALKQEPDLYKVIPASGLKVVGFGVDGTTEEVWKSQHKGNRSLLNADTAFEICRGLGITPEALMVMGFHDANGNPVDNRDSLRKNVEYSVSRARTYGAVARPHVAKDMVPGNNGWKNPIWAKQRAILLEQPELFRNLDFVALASELTHPNEEFRQEINNAYLDIVRELTPRGLCVTSPLMPYTGNPNQDKVVDTFNMLIPFDK